MKVSDEKNVIFECCYGVGAVFFSAVVFWTESITFLMMS